MKSDVLELLCYSSAFVRIHFKTVLFQIYCIPFLWVIFLLYLMCMCNLCDSVNVNGTFFSFCRVYANIVIKECNMWFYLLFIYVAIRSVVLR